jgi:hypothetical protein
MVVFLCVVGSEVVLYQRLSSRHDDGDVGDTGSDEFAHGVFDNRLVSDRYISFGMAFVNGSSREPRPAAGITALRIVVGIVSSFSLVRPWCLLRWRQSGPHQLD